MNWIPRNAGTGGISVNAPPRNRRPRTETGPPVAVNVALPRLPSIAASPGKALRTFSTLLNGGRTMGAEVAIILPLISLTVTVTVDVPEPAFANATAVSAVRSSYTNDTFPVLLRPRG